MTKTARAGMAAVTAALALALSPAALAAFTSPTLTVTSTQRAGGAPAQVVIRAQQNREDDAPARVTIYVPQEYGGTFVQPSGTQVGTVTARVQANAISPDAVIELTGTITTATYTPSAFPQGAACAGTPAIDVVYLLALQAAGQTLQLPVYVSRTAGTAEGAFSTAKLTVCMPSPYVPPAQGGAAFGAKLIDASLSFPSLLMPPPSGGEQRWRSIWTPYTVGTTTPNTAGTVEVQAVEFVGGRLTLRAGRVNQRTRRVTLSGSLFGPDAGIARVRVTIVAGRRTIARATTNARGAYRVTVRLARRGAYVLRARVAVPAGTTACRATAAFPCLRATASGFSATSAAVRVRVR